MTWFVGLSAATVALEDLFTVGYLEANEALDKSIQKYKETKEAINSLNAEYKTNKERILNTKEMEKNTTTIVSNFNKIQKGIESNTTALQELPKALKTYPETLNNSGNTDVSDLDKLKKIILAMDTLKSITSKFQNVGRGKMFPFIHCYCFENVDINMCSLGY